MKVVPINTPAILPAGGLQKLEHVIPEDEFTKFFRLIGWSRTHGMITMFFCPLCNQPIKLTHDAPIQLTDGLGPAAPQKRLDCACQRWVIR